MQKLLFIIIFSFVLESVRSQPGTLLISKKEIKEFLTKARPFLREEPLPRLSDKPVPGFSKIIPNEISPKDTFLTKADLDFFVKQEDRYKNVIWDSSFIDNVILIKSAGLDSISAKTEIREGWEQIYKRYGGGYHELSLPYFSIDRQTCILIAGYMCGPLCGEGSMLVFRKKEEGWILFKKISLFVS